MEYNSLLKLSKEYADKAASIEDDMFRNIEDRKLKMYKAGKYCKISKMYLKLAKELREGSNFR